MGINDLLLSEFDAEMKKTRTALWPGGGAAG